MYQSANNKRIAKNTLLLYVRMLFGMLVSLFTSRVILQTLGVEDYGVYNVVGGVITMFTFLNSAMSSATSRYITFEIGKGNMEQLKKVFSTALQIHDIIALLIVILGETVGLWFLMNELVIPEGRMDAAMWVYQCSIVSCVVGIMSVPYNADIIAHEKMSAFAYISVLEILLKLAIVYLLVALPFDKLKVYAVLVLMVGLLIRYIYTRYCHKHLEESHYIHRIDKTLIKEMSSFAGWSFWGNLYFVLYSQGLNMMLNIFFGSVVNAARGVAKQVDAALKQFVSSFTTAVNPQITKSYAQGDLESMHKLVCRSAKFSAFLMMFFAVPIILKTDTILTLWLKNPPAYASIFLKWIIISSFMDTVLANSLVTSMFATGNIKRYQIIVTTVGCLVFPLSWLAFQLGFEPQVGYILYFIIYSILLFIRLYLLRDMVKLPIMMYVREVLFKVLPTMAICFTIPSLLLFSMGEGVVRLILIVVLSTIVSSFTIYHIGLSEGEKKYLIELTNKVPIIYKIKNKVMEINDKITNRGVKPNLASASCTFGENYSNDMYNFNWRTAR